MRERLEGGDKLPRLRFASRACIGKHVVRIEEHEGMVVVALDTQIGDPLPAPLGLDPAELEPLEQRNGVGNVRRHVRIFPRKGFIKHSQRALLIPRIEA